MSEGRNEMENTYDELHGLIKEGKDFTFENFSCRQTSGKQYGGEDTHEWLEWKSRAYVIVKKLNVDPLSSNLVEQGMEIATKGNSSDKFHEARGKFLQSLMITLASSKITRPAQYDSSKSNTSPEQLSKNVFVVHGHDNEFKTQVEVFLGELGLKPIVLHRMPDEGKTIIEKFEKHSDVGFVFILLSPDDVAYSSSEAAVPDQDRKKENRARQNVIFEFGYFVGKIGRSRVCALYKGNITLPSDISGLIYKEIINSVESQGFSIIKELKAAGYKIDI
jgi:predicted nucleotide-binding protein